MTLVTSGVSAGEMGKETSLIQLSVENPDPTVARDVANALAEAYAEQNRVSKAQEATMTLGFIDAQLKNMGSDLDRSEQALQEFRIRTGLERLSPEGASLVDAAVNFEKQRAELSLKRQRIAGFIEALNGGNADFAAVQDVPGVQPEVTRLLELRAKRNELLRSYTPAHPAVIEIDDALRQVEEKIAGATRLAQRSLDQQLGDVGRALDRNTSRLQQMPEEELELVRLTRANKVNSELYGYLLQRQQEARIRQAATSSAVEIIDRAQTPGAPVKPNTKKNLALGLVLGGMLGIGLTFLLDYLDQTIKDEDDVQEKLGLAVLGTIPKIGPAENGAASRLITCLEPLSPACEAFLALRTNLLYIVTNQKHKTILVTSCLPAEGKSTVAANLAVTLAQTGAKTLLVDCDLRRPSLHRIFEQSDLPGLSDLLVDAAQAGDAVRHLTAMNLDLIPDGTEPPNPTQLLNSTKMRDFLSDVHERYDYVVLDVPPLLPVADALILASQVDLNVLVIESCRIPEKLAVRALKSLHSHGAAPAGAVLNDKTGKGAKYYGAYSYYEGKYYQGYYRRNEPVPAVPVWRRVVEKVWGFING
jgi:tyrosine-protein kinase Etk/Wzc